jgi:acetyl esterase/lipase
VIVHSGAWSEGTHSDLDWLCEEGARHGFAAFTVDYRLLPAAYPDQLDDVVAAVDWIRAAKQAKRFGVDPSRIALLGTSAGAGIVAELLTGTPGSPVKPSRFVGGAMLSAIFDFPAVTTETTSAAELKVPLEYAGCTSVDCTKLADVSAVLHVDKSDPPMFLANSTNELVPQVQATEMDAALKKAGVRHELHIADGTDHAEFIVQNHKDIDTAMWTFLTSIAR